MKCLPVLRQVFNSPSMSSLDLRLIDPETYSPETKRLFSILQNYLQPNKLTTLEATAASILKILPKQNPESTEVWMFGELCIELAEQIPYHHPLQLKLLGLGEYLKLNPQLCRIFEDTDAKVCTLFRRDGEILRNLRQFSRTSQQGTSCDTPV